MIEKPKRKCTNEVIEDHGGWLLVDISTDNFPTATMKVNSDVWKNHKGGRVYAQKDSSRKYIYAKYHHKTNTKYFHHGIIDVAEGLIVDHSTHGTINFIDNRRSNLRAVTHKQNNMNRSMHSNNKSGIVGVFWSDARKRWRTQIKLEGKQKHLGYFKDKKTAIKARQKAEKQYFGEYTYNKEQ